VCDDLPSEGISITTGKIYPRCTRGGGTHFKAGQKWNIKSREVSEWELESQWCSCRRDKI